MFCNQRPWKTALFRVLEFIQCFDFEYSRAERQRYNSSQESVYGETFLLFCAFWSTMPPIPVVNGDVGEKLANESASSESLDQSNSFDKTKEPFLPAEEKSGDPEKIALKKNVSLINGIGLIVGTVIGSGIFVSPKGILEESNSIGASLLVWLGCGALALFGSLCYAELGTCFKKSGGEYAYLMEAFGRIPAYLFAWTSVLIIRPASGAIIALIFAEYVTKPFYPDSPAPTYLLKLLACSCLGKWLLLLLLLLFDSL